MKIGVIGRGFVGGAITNGFENQGHEVLVHDTKLNTKIENVLESRLLYICVPTPSSEDGSCNTDIVESVLVELSELNYDGSVCIKSTIVPGTTQKFRQQFNNLNISFVPEFLREKTAVEDFLYNNNVLVIGSDDDETISLVKESHGVLPTHTVTMTPTEAELTKYFSNTYKAMRVTFANAFYNLCQTMGSDYDKVRDAFLFHGVGDGHYLKVNKQYGGFGGTCLPKDSKALAKLVDDLGLPMDIFKVIVSDNDKFTKTNQDDRVEI
jgi:UDPglucose 6-dehydrogenase|tara:strand:+ start:24 stop:821 length:798 start_codon:yes stop_codon:yes gene_type:complete